MKKEKKNTSFIRWILKAILLSIVLVGVLLTLVTGAFVWMQTNADYREIATATSVNVAHMLDSMSDEDYSYDEVDGVLRKGDVVITDEAFWKSLEFDEDIHHTIFWGKTRVLTDVTDEKGKIVVGTTLSDQNIINTVEEEGLYTDNNVTIYGSKYSVCYYPLKNGGEIVGYVFTGVKQEEANSQITYDTLITIGLVIVIAVIIIFIMTKLVKKKSKGFETKLTMVAETAEDKRASVSQLGRETNSNMEQINQAISQMSQAVTQQAGHTEEIMRTMSDFGNNLDVIMEQVGNTSSVTSNSTTLMDQLRGELDELRTASKENSEEIVNITKQIEEDNKAVGNIGQIVNVINDIAFQITILSFNASVEAARAGEAGKGFAVVAESIKELSDKTQASVSDITRIIEEVNEQMLATERTSELLMNKNDKMVETLEATTERVNSVSSAFDTISNGIARIQNESDSILRAKNQVVETVASLAASSEENAAMSEQVASTSHVVINLTEDLKTEIDRLQIISDTVAAVKSEFN